MSQLLQSAGTPANKNRVVKMLWCDRYGSAQNCKGNTRTSTPANKVNEDPSISPVLQVQKYTFINYNFVVPIDASASISKFWFEVDEKNGSAPAVYNNGGDGYVLDQDQVLFVPTLSHQDLLQDADGNFTHSYLIVAAVKIFLGSPVI